MIDLNSWLMLLSSLPGDNKTARMRIWRALKASGAGTLRDGASLLPASDRARAVFELRAAEIIAAGGSAHILAFAAIDSAQEQEFVSLFDRSAEYADLLGRLRAFKAGVAGRSEVDVRRQLAGMRRDFAALVAIDYFPGIAPRQVEDAIADGDAAINARFSADEPQALAGNARRCRIADYRGRTWATRERMWIDRVASAWLIRRFIDPEAAFVWLKRPQDCPKAALGFDFDGAEFTHVGARVTFEVLASAFALDKNPALVRMGVLIHYLDVGGVAMPEAAGLAAIAAGARARSVDDDQFLKDMGGVFDALHACYAQPDIAL